MRSVTAAELRQHVPGIDHCGRAVACSCGWKLPPPQVVDDYWMTWLEHLPAMQSGKLHLTVLDREFLRKCRITL